MRGLHVLLLLVSIVAALPQQVLRRAESGCGKTQFLPGVTQYRFGLKSSGKDRSYSYHLPGSYDKNKRYPVVLGFHGSSSTGLFFELDTKLSEARFSGEKVMVYPNGLGGSWAGASYHDGSTLDEDIQFVSDIVADVKTKFCVEDEKIFAAGMSNGGGFIGALACSPIGSSLFAAFAAGSGAFYTDLGGPDNGCKPARTPVPMLEVHGYSDKTVHYAGGKGEGGELPPIPSWLDWWAQRNGCSNVTTEITHDGDVHHDSWTCGGRAGLLQHYRVDKMGHCWADTEINLSQISVPQGPASVQASSIIMKFFDDISAGK